MGQTVTTDKLGQKKAEERQLHLHLLGMGYRVNKERIPTFAEPTLSPM
jgi:hypothetical protein